jgi:hypothetical protein
LRSADRIADVALAIETPLRVGTPPLVVKRVDVRVRVGAPSGVRRTA